MKELIMVLFICCSMLAFGAKIKKNQLLNTYCQSEGFEKKVRISNVDYCVGDGELKEIEWMNGD